MKAILIGLDGATKQILEPLYEQGGVPHLGRLMVEGSYSELDNMGYGKSPVIWTSLATGQPPDVHGIYDFTTLFIQVGRRGYRLRLLDSLPGRFKRGVALLSLGLVKRASVRSNMRTCEAMWNWATTAGLSVGVVNWWGTFPAERVNGFIVSDHANAVRLKGRADAGSFGYSVSQFMSQPGLVYPSVITDHLQGLDVLHDGDLVQRAERFANLSSEEWSRFRQIDKLRKHDPLTVLKFAMLQDEFALRITRQLCTQYGPPDLLLVMFAGLDAASHHFWKYAFPDEFSPIPVSEMDKFSNTLMEYYVWMDEVVGEIIDMSGGESHVIVVSDHGFRSVKPGGSQGPISGTHDPDPPKGILLCGGPAFAPSRTMNATMLDITPTLLYLAGTSVPRALSGRVLTEGMRDDYLQANPIHFTDNVESARKLTSRTIEVGQSEEAVLDRLRSLGYIE